MLDIPTIVEIIRRETSFSLERGTVTSSDPRGTRSTSVRLSGGRSCSRPRSCVTDLQPGDEVVVAHLPGINGPVIIARIAHKYEAARNNTGHLAPPDNLSVTPIPAALCVRWDTYPGEDLSWQIRYNSSASDTGATDVLVTRGSYYLHWIVDASGDMDTAAQVYFKVRALRWIGDNNVMFSAWSAWGNDTSGGHNLREIVELEFEDAAALMISGGAITRTQVYHRVDTANSIATDDLDTINGGAEGDLLIIRPEHGDRTVVVKHNTDNIWLMGKADVSLDDLNDHIALIYDGSMWCDIGGGGGGGGSSTFLGLTDTPGSYAGEKRDLLQVNEAENALVFVTASQDVEVAAAGVATVIGLQTYPISDEAPEAGDYLQWIIDAAGCPGTSDISEFWGPSEIDPGTIDHGGLLGLADDDHTQYSLVNGTRAFTGAVTFNLGMTFAGASGANVITVPDNVANAAHIVDAGGLEYLRVVSTNAQPLLHVNQGAADIDFRVDSAGFAPALFVQGSTGYVGVNVTPLYPFHADLETTGVAGVIYTAAVALTANPGAGSAAITRAMQIGAYVKAANAQNITGSLAGLYGFAYHQGTGTLAAAYGNLYAVYSSHGGTITNSYCIYLETALLHAGGGDQIGTAHGLYIQAPYWVAGKTIGTQYGIYLTNHYSAGTTCWSIYSLGGTARFFTGGAAVPGLYITAAASQSANLQEWQNSAGASLMDVEAGGCIDYRWAMGNSSKNPHLVAEDDWVQIKINGSTYYLPAYLA